MIASASESDQRVTPPTVSPTIQKPVPHGPNDHRAQMDWEHFQVAKGIERYRRTLVKERKDGTTAARSLEETKPGQRIATELIGPVVEAVENALKGYAETLNESGPALKKLPDDLTALSTLPAETLAACAVLTALANPVEASYQSVRIACAARVRHELEYQEWRRKEAEAEKDRKESGEDGINMFKLMLRRNNGEIDKRVFDNWSKKAGTLVKIEWDQDQKVRIGDCLMGILVEATTWFKVENVFAPETGKMKLTFGMTPEALQKTVALDAQCELQRPFLAPMICEPKDYEYIESAAAN